jgi:hypothetical protein
VWKYREICFLESVLFRIAIYKNRREEGWSGEEGITYRFATPVEEEEKGRFGLLVSMGGIFL